MNYKNRGMLLENLINKAIIIYTKKEIGIFHKKHLPINFSGITKTNGKLEIKHGWLASRAEADYYGLYEGVFIAFEAKSTNLESLPLINIKVHQSNYIKKVLAHGGLGFYIILYKTYDEFYLIEQSTLDALNKKSLSIKIARKKGYKINLVYPGYLDFISVVNQLI